LVKEVSYYLVKEVPYHPKKRNLEQVAQIAELLLEEEGLHQNDRTPDIGVT
jgi:hypothetical protein